ncbi:MAG: ABC transporter ATP-binding protein [Atribacterota bacterium]|nr:ABC transporter ATP-binding protein [Atribacterota bacterium]
MYLELKNINVFYEKVQAIKNVSLSLKQGEVVALLGANGAGKTTALRSINGLSRIYSGEIWFQNNRIDKIPSYERVSLGISTIPEERGIFPYMSVKDNLLMGAHICKDKEEIRNSLEKIYNLFPRLKERYMQMGGNLSGGEQQMLAVGRCMISGPKVILMDEPSLGLSPIFVNKIADIIVMLNKNEKVSIILVEQNARMALEVADRAYILRVGEIVLEGKSEDLINNKIVKEIYLGG